VGVSNGPTQRLDAERIRGVRRPPNGAPAGLYVSRAAAAPGTLRPPTEARVRRLRELARAGRLADAAATASGYERQALTGAAYDVAWPIVYSRLTRRFEQRRGHHGCASGVDRLADECLDRFHDDVEAVVDDVLAHARQPVLHLEAWIASRLTAATVNGHRRQRGLRGALQRPRLPGWLAAALDHDRWRMELAVEMLVWVGVPATAGNEVWPLDAWAQHRGALTRDWSGSEPAAVAREVDEVLAVMRRRPQWYESYVERPLGAKHAPVTPVPLDGGTGAVARPLDLADPHARVDAELLRLATEAVRVIDERVARGERAEAIVVEVIRTVFGGPFTGTLDRAPHQAADPLGGVTGALSDQARVRRIVGTVLGIIRERGQTAS
jgi:hypothetical protein